MLIYDNYGAELSKYGIPSMSSSVHGVGKMALVSGKTDYPDNSSYLVHTANGPNQWVSIAVQLKPDQYIDKVIINNRVDCCRDRILGMSLEIYNNSILDSNTTIFSSALKIEIKPREVFYLFSFN
jgi:hypothetical protein